MIDIRHLRAMMLRHWYILRHSPPYIINIMCWPIMNILVWGFMNHYMAQTYGVGDAQARYVGGTLIMAALFWDLFIRASWGFTGTVGEEFHSRNLGGMMATPMSQTTYIFGCVIASFIKNLVGFFAVPIVVSLAFGFSVFSLGWTLLPYVALLLCFGWAFGLLISSLLFIWSLRAEPLCWFTPMICCALMAPYYPVASMPVAAQAIAHLMPATYVFESMRADIAGAGADWRGLGVAAVLCVVWFGAAVVIYLAAFRSARRRGRLLSVGE